uniref:Uncharacterized protein n=1 Tax=Wolbachia endosymbiont of Aleurodicus floccissimus TaxID=2152762 RepID=A0A3B0IX56_9RICK
MLYLFALNDENNKLDFAKSEFCVGYLKSVIETGAETSAQ